MLSPLLLCVFISELQECVMITNEKFVEVLKSLTKEDFDTAQKVLLSLSEKFDDLTTIDLFTESEIKEISSLLESYDGEVRVSVLVYKFKELLCSQQQ